MAPPLSVRGVLTQFRANVVRLNVGNGQRALGCCALNWVRVRLPIGRAPPGLLEGLFPESGQLRRLSADILPDLRSSTRS